jgi:hypothetical protein
VVLGDREVVEQAGPGQVDVGVWTMRPSADMTL